MLIAAAVCPHPPLLVPEVAGEAARELDALRAACHEAIRRLPLATPGFAGLPTPAPNGLRVPRTPQTRTPPPPGVIMQPSTGPRSGSEAADLLVVVGADEETRGYGPDAAGSLRPYGIDLTIGPGEPVLPLSLTIGRWLLGRVVDFDDVADAVDPGGLVPVRFQGIAEEAAPLECLRLGRELAGAAERVALLVMGDGSACRAEKPADEGLDERAEPYDAAVARALRDADAAALAALDPALSGELQVAGRAAWQVLAGAVGAAGAVGTVGAADTVDAAGATGSRRSGFDDLDGLDGFSGVVLAAAAPYGVGYFVASWLRG